MSSASPAGAAAQYQSELNQGRFVVQRCDNCRKHVFFPRQICPHCGGGALTWVEPTGMAIVYSASVVRRKADAGGDYNVALIDLDEGVRLMSRVEGIPAAEVRIGMRVKAKVLVHDGQGLVVFERVTEQAR